MNESWGFEPWRSLACVCGFGAVVPTLRDAERLTAAHVAEGCEGCDHVVDLVTL
jgi:hypothetical protein